MIGWLIVLIISLVIINAVYINLRNNIYIIVIYFLFLLRSSSSSACPSIFAHQKKKKNSKNWKILPIEKMAKMAQIAVRALFFSICLRLETEMKKSRNATTTTTHHTIATGNIVIATLESPAKTNKKKCAPPIKKLRANSKLSRTTPQYYSPTAPDPNGKF